jgi:hypothetical protein
VGSSSFAWERELVIEAKVTPPPKAVRTIRRVCISGKKIKDSQQVWDGRNQHSPNHKWKTPLLWDYAGVKYILENPNRGRFWFMMCKRLWIFVFTFLTSPRFAKGIRMVNSRGVYFHFCFFISSICIIFLVVLGFELKASHLLGRCYITWAILPVLLYLSCRM